MKPWSYRVTVAIPYRNTPDYLDPLLRLMRMQTVRPFFVIADLGGQDWPRQFGIPAMNPERFRAADVEVYYVAGEYQNASEGVCVAMDVMQSACRTPYFFSVHPDCFPMRRDLLEWMMARCNAKHPVIGHEMTKRFVPEWKGYVGHTATMFHMPTVHRIGMTWSMRRSLYLGEPPDFDCWGGWPDTETTFNRVLRSLKIKPRLIGREKNMTRTRDRFIDHVRSGTVNPFARKRTKDLAIKDAWRRIKEWEGAR
jgi:hypothetical protein